MNGRPGDVIPFRFDLSALVRRSVATLYSHLVTRPTGQALRLGIESQIEELAAPCISVLDFTQVAVLDYSCADEAVAKLLQRFQRDDRPADAYFVARGVGDHHRETLDEVLNRHGLALVAEVDQEGFTLLGTVEGLEEAAWRALERRARAGAGEVAAEAAVPEPDAAGALEALARRRVVVSTGRPAVYHALSGLLDHR